LGAILNVVLNIFAIQKWSYIGASITTVITEAFGFIIMFIYLKSYLKESTSSYYWVVKLTLIVLWSLFGYYLTLKVIKNFIILLLIYSFIYWVGVLSLKIIDTVDFNLFKKVFERGEKV